MKTNCLCKHPPDQVTADILQGDWDGHQVKWCRKCGAFMIRVYDENYLHSDINKDSRKNYLSPWEVPSNSIDPLCPTPELQGSFPVVIYFGNAEDAAEFVEACSKEKNFTARQL